MSSHELETRSKILAASLRLLEAHGGKNVRMSDIAKAADVSRQAVYLHFENRTQLMVETVQYGDQVRDAQAQSKAWRESEGVEKLDAWVTFWGNYIPQIFGVAKALMIAKEIDEAAAAAWDDRMNDVRKSCNATIKSLDAAGALVPQWRVREASDVLWVTLSISNWELLTKTCGWSYKKYVQQMQKQTRHLLVK